ncbi:MULTISPECIES: hypothetical protein [Aeromonas]|uniref:hypothetical protein n=1 Tax=Aeromonas TaxID=642 RepID=UPI001C21BE3C|nr:MULTISPECIES: hypothetical protein [Aeromonas]QWZ80580.1 hypothetical protein I6L44_15985 [Aeromonas sp. FDAARGOS 1414]
MGHSNGKTGQRESRHCPFLPAVYLPGWRCVSSEDLWKNETAEVPGKDLLLFIRPLHVVRNLARLGEGRRWKNEEVKVPSRDLLLFIRPLHVARNLAQLEEDRHWENETAEAIAKDLLLFIRPFLGHNLVQ